MIRRASTFETQIEISSNHRRVAGLGTVDWMIGLEGSEVGWKAS
jgi:hypothetical protein